MSVDKKKTKKKKKKKKKKKTKKQQRYLAFGNTQHLFNIKIRIINLICVFGKIRVVSDVSRYLISVPERKMVTEFEKMLNVATWYITLVFCFTSVSFYSYKLPIPFVQDIRI